MRGRRPVYRSFGILSKTYKTDGPPCEEYVDRMNLGLADALELGMSQLFVDMSIRRFIRTRSLQNTKDGLLM